MKYRFLGKPDKNFPSLVTDEIYELEVTVIGSQPIRPLIISPFTCPYSSWETFYENWKPILTDKPKRAVNKDNVQEFVDLYNGKSKEKCTCNKYAISGDCPVHCVPTPFKTKPEIEKIDLSPLTYNGKNYEEDSFFKVENKINEIINFLSTKDKEEGE